jgi:hypothetical protein
MDWYWWVLLAIVIFFVVRSIISGSQEPAADELALIFDRLRSEGADANRELAKVVEAITALPVIESTAPYGNTLSREKLAGSIRNFLESKLRTEWKTQTKMVHVVLSPKHVTIFAKLRPTQAQAAARDFMRIADNIWTFSTRQVDEMQNAILQTEQEAQSQSPRFGLVFDIDGLADSLYGHAAYLLLFRTVCSADRKLLSNSRLWDGDTNATLAGKKRDYVIAIEQPDRAASARIRELCSSITHPALGPVHERFLTEEELKAEPLVVAARINELCVMDWCDTSWIYNAWAKANKSIQSSSDNDEQRDDDSGPDAGRQRTPT